MKTERDFRNYLAGAALAFGIILITFQLTRILLAGWSIEELTSIEPLLSNVWLGAHLIGGLIGGFLVARKRQVDYIQTGTLVAVLAYIFEFIYNFLVENMSTDIYALVSLMIGGIVGAMFFRAGIERGKLESSKRKKATVPEYETEKTPES